MKHLVFVLSAAILVLPGTYCYGQPGLYLTGGSATTVHIVNNTFVTTHDLTVQPGKSLVNDSSWLQIGGSYTNAGTVVVSSGTIELNGATAQTIPSNAFYNNALNNLVVSNTYAGGVSIAGHLDIYGSLTYSGSGKSLSTNDNLTLKSTAIATARVGDLTGNSINGTVTVERYISANKAWRFLSVPTNTGQTIQQTWQEGCGASTNCVTGFGTQITGPGGTAAGFDAYSPGSSIKTYDPATNTWVAITNTHTGIKATDGYMTFIRGDRTVTSPFASATETVLRTKGNLYTGNQPAITVLPSKFAAVGNPYASAIDMRNISTTGIKDFFYLWDPLLAGGSGYGGYQTFSSDGSGNYVVTPGGGSYGAIGSISNYIQSGQAFLVQATVAGGSITFKEGAKTTGSSLASLPASMPQPALRVSLFGENADHSRYLADGFLINYGMDFSNALDDMDAIKSANSSENLAIKSNNALLVIERRHTVISQDTIFFKLSNVKVQHYRFDINATELFRPGLAGYFVDNYLNTSTPLHIDGTTTVDFDITSVPGSYASDRFYIVFRQTGVLPVTFSSLRASRRNKDIDVAWTVENEGNIKNYEVEKSADGIHFNTIHVMAAAGSATFAPYQFVDQYPFAGYNYYRVKSIDINANVAYSPIAKVLADDHARRTITIFPNPVENGIINLWLSGEPDGTYYMRLINPSGQAVFSKRISHSGENSVETFQPGSNLRHGIYQVEVITPDNDRTMMTILY